MQIAERDHSFAHGRVVARPDNISIEMIVVLDNFGSDKINLFDDMDEIGDSRTIVQISLCRITLSKLGAIECGLHRTTILMSHITRI